MKDIPSQDHKSLLKREIDVNLQEQILLTKRIAIMQVHMQDIPNYDPIYFSLDKQILIDRIQLDELQQEQEELISRLKCLEPEKN